MWLGELHGRWQRAVLLDLARHFNASAEATTLRVVALSPVPAGMIVLEPNLKPAGVRELARRQSQPTLPGLEGEDPVTPRLRVQKSLAQGLSYIPRHKSIDESTRLAHILTMDRVE
jgi:hypothetical protein